MKSSAAFALGLWTGAAVVAAVGAFYWRVWRPMPVTPVPRMEAEWQAKDEEIRRLRQEQARWSAEEQRLRQTNTELKNNLVARAASRSEERARRIPFRRTSATAPESWILDAVANADTNALEKLVAAATQDDPFALEAIALLADRDGAATLPMFVDIFALAPDTRIKEAQFIAATVETSPHAEEWVRALFNRGSTDTHVLSAAITGLGWPAFPSVLAAQDLRIKPPPHFQPDYALRLRLLGALPARVEDEQLRTLVGRVREELQSHLPASTAPQPVQ